MSATKENFYRSVLVPTLQRIQEEYGHLERSALQRYAQESGVPLYRIQEVASFFPHFRLSPARRIVLRICRDMACSMAGSAELRARAGSLEGDEVAVESVSCQGRCDRAPAACFSVKGLEHDHYYLGRSFGELDGVAAGCLQGLLPPADRDGDLAPTMAAWMVETYEGPSDYAAVRNAVAVRDASLAAAMELLAERSDWRRENTEQFRFGAIRQMRVEVAMDAAVAQAVRCWQLDDDWAKGAHLGGWSDGLLEELKQADLRGMGGAGIPAIQKWRDVRDAVRTARGRQADDRAFIVVNGDESEPGTFKDRELLLRTPHLIIEGVILAGLITEATQGFIYIRHEYSEQIAACREEIRRAEQLGICGENASVLGRPFPISVFVSPGGYICGEQSALIEAMSDRRGEPRNLPPKLETNGLQDLPTLVSNVETFIWVPFILLRGGQAYADQGVNGWKGRRFFSISGDVQRPGVYEVPMGLTVRELLFGEGYCQGMVGDRPLKALAPSGPSGGFLPAKLTVASGLPKNHTSNETWLALAARRGFDPAAGELDILDLELELNVFRALSPTQALGAGMVVYAEGRDMLEQAANANEFFRQESCGKCVPCRLGSQKLADLGRNLLEGRISAARWQEEILPLVQEMGTVIELASICGLGRSVPVPLRTVVRFFPEDLAQHLGAAENAVRDETREDVSCR